MHLADDYWSFLLLVKLFRVESFYYKKESKWEIWSSKVKLKEDVFFGR